MRLQSDPRQGQMRNTEVWHNIVPTQQVLFVHNDSEGKQTVNEGRWWLVPFWAKEIPKATLFNARIETLDTTPPFRDAFKSRRCLTPADGFYEWTAADGGRKDSWHIFLPGGAPSSFAGLWAHHEKLGITSCSIVTAPAEEPMTRLHDRQPFIQDRMRMRNGSLRRRRRTGRESFQVGRSIARWNSIASHATSTATSSPARRRSILFSQRAWRPSFITAGQ